MRFKTYRIESVIPHRVSFSSTFIKLGYADIRRHGVKQNLLSKEIK